MIFTDVHAKTTGHTLTRFCKNIYFFLTNHATCWPILLSEIAKIHISTRSQRYLLACQTLSLLINVHFIPHENQFSSYKLCCWNFTCNDCIENIACNAEIVVRKEHFKKLSTVKILNKNMRGKQEKEGHSWLPSPRLDGISSLPHPHPDSSPLVIHYSAQQGS